jgi:hypothetical protein
MLDDHQRLHRNRQQRRPRDLAGPGTDRRAVHVREPVWNWGFGGQLINGDGSAIAYIVLGVLLDGFAVLILFAIYKAVRHWLRHRRQPASGPAIG